MSVHQLGGWAATGRPASLVRRPLNEFLDHKYPPRENIISPWLPTRGLVMIAGWRGIGKTMFALGAAYAIASGGSFLDWEAPRPRKVIYVDGETDPVDLQDRLGAIMAAAKVDGNGDIGAALENLILVCDGDQGDNGMPDLAGENVTGRRDLEALLQSTKAEVLVLDNLSVLFRNSGAADNDQESWIAAQEWLLKLRRKGVTVIILQHTGKPDKYGNTKQRGTSKKEDVLNTSILLNVPSKKDKQYGVSFAVEFTKHRGFTPGDEFSVSIDYDIKKGECRLRRINKMALVVMMLEEGKSQAEIAEHFNVDQSTVSRWLKRKAGAEGGQHMQPPSDLHTAA